MQNHYGALSGAWDHFDLILGLGEDLLPIAANPNAGISPTSTLTSVGKVPSTYNSKGQVIGMPKWTEIHASVEQIAKWSSNPELGMCLQTRRIRAIDVDIPDAKEAGEVSQALDQFYDCFPMRRRSDSSKFLILLDCAGELPKRRFKTQHGVIEFLGTGQQCVIDSTHPSGVRYEWPFGWPNKIPVLTLEQLNELWTTLADRFAIEDTVTGSLSTKKQQLTEIISADPVAQALSDQGMVISQAATGMLAIHCPFEDGHSPGSSATSTVYFPPHTGGYEFGHFDCKHASCAHRDDTNFKEAIGVSVSDLFSVVEDEDVRVVEGERKPAYRFEFQHASEYVNGPQPRWIVHDLLPYDEVGMIYGESGSGKSFFVMDLILAVARGVPWRGVVPVVQGSVAYIAAEGAIGVRNRVKAYMQHNKLPVEDIPLYILGDSPNLLELKDAKDLTHALVQLGKGLQVVVIDTMASVTPGGDENSGKDMKRAINHCKAIHKATGALVLLIHHSGKDASRGARGWSGMKGAWGVEICVTRDGEERIATVTKQKDGDDSDKDFGFTLEGELLGSDQFGLPLYSCTVNHFDLCPKNERKQPVRGTEQTLLDFITDFQDERSEWPLIADILEALPRAGALLEKLKEKNQVEDVGGRIERRLSDRREVIDDVEEDAE